MKEKSSSIKYDTVNGCGHCGCKELPHILPKDPTSDVYCKQCGAQYYSVNHSDSKLAGTFKDRYRPVSTETQYKHGFHNQQ